MTCEICKKRVSLFKIKRWIMRRMKKAPTIIVLLFSPLLFSQNSELKLFDFILENQELIWQHVYESDLKKEELSNLYINNVLSSMSKNNLNQFKDRITFEIEGDKVNIKKYGGSWGSTAIFAQYPQNYLAVIDLKDNKYRVTVKNIKTDYRRAKQGFSDLAITVTKKRKTQFKDAKSVTMGLSYIDKHFLNKFDMKKIKKEADVW